MARGLSLQSAIDLIGEVTPESFTALFIDDPRADNAPALQAALDHAHANTMTVKLSGRVYSTGRLIYKGQRIEGAGEGKTIVRGRPQQDVFYAPDFSIGETGGVGTLANMHISNLTVEVDNSVPPSLGPGKQFDRPVYPAAPFPTNTRITRRQWFRCASGIYVAMTNGTTGAAPPTHVSGVAQNGTATFAFVRKTQLYVGNVGFAFPCYDGSKVVEPFIIQACFDKVQVRNIVPDKGTNFRNSTGFFYSQRAFYNSHFAASAYKMTFGFIMVPPTINYFDTQYAPDCNHWVRVLAHCTYPFVMYNGVFNVFDGYQGYGTGGPADGTTGTVDHESLHLLEYLTVTRAYQEGHVFNAFYFEGGETSGSKVESVIMGFGHVFNGGGLTNLGKNKVLFLADSCAFSQFFVGANKAGDARLLVYGANNRGNFHTSHDTPGGTVIADFGRGNDFTLDFTTFGIFAGGRPRSLTRGRDAAGKFRGDFAALGLAQTPMLNADDLTFTPSEVSWVTGRALAPQVTKTAATISGEYVTLPTGGESHFAARNGGRIVAGVNVPLCLCRCAIEVRSGAASSAQSFAWRDADARTVQRAAFRLSPGFVVYEWDVDFGAYGAGTELIFSVPASDGAPASIDISRISITPIPVQTVGRVSADNGDADKALRVTVSEQTQRWATPLSVPRKVTVSTANAQNGHRFRIVRAASATGSSGLDIAGLRVLPSGSWCEIEFDGRAWILTQFGQL